MQKGSQGNRKKRMERPLLVNRQVFLGAAALVAAAVLLIIGLYPRNATAPEITGSAPPENAADVSGGQASAQVEAGCELIQVLTYSRCGHEVTRRTPLPQELTGKTVKDVQTAYEGWQVTEFLPKRITMTRLFPLYCSSHVVLMPDESGVLSVFENKYGDAMAFTQSLQISLTALPESVQEEVRQGKGFDSLEDMEQWLESRDS